MKQFITVLLSLLIASSSGFAASSFSGTTMSVASTNGNTLSMEYIPTGMSKDQWKKIKDNERKKTQGKNLGTVGITSFKSRSFADWQKSGGKNLFPVDPTTVKNQKDIPYMQRPGGSADDVDLKKINPFSMFAPKKKKEVEAAPDKPTNWWTL